jgi:hypothetical protein
MDPQRDLLGHRAAREQDRGLFAQQLGYSAFKGLDELTLAVLVRPGAPR